MGKGENDWPWFCDLQQRLKAFYGAKNSIGRLDVLDANPLGVIEEDHLLQRSPEVGPLRFVIMEKFGMVTRALL